MRQLQDAECMLLLAERCIMASELEVLIRTCAPRTRSSQVSFTPAPGHHGPWVQQQRKTRAKPRTRTSPPPVFEISTRNCFAPLRETERGIVIGDSIVRYPQS
ncbi:hypothetical protein Q8A67_021118 [Cirrhinus molitorella]|uniref:Uncharacterized protein n=1 Tax=Cirrhinus molitorella TaxID=172907 RepID=A0AA88PA49_9TELE|nr:hypothetical protein Q8A67_021118 [Cirrhinus molitorella]